MEKLLKPLNLFSPLYLIVLPVLKYTQEAAVKAETVTLFSFLGTNYSWLEGFATEFILGEFILTGKITPSPCKLYRISSAGRHHVG